MVSFFIEICPKTRQRNREVRGFVENILVTASDGLPKASDKVADNIYIYIYGSKYTVCTIGLLFGCI